MFRDGQWVKFLPLAAGCQVAADGMAVGIYRAAGPDGAGGRAPHRVFYAAPDGGAVAALEGGELVRQAWLDPADCVGLAPVTERADIPAARVAHLPPGWRPEP